MEAAGYLLFVLNSHQPYVREPERTNSIEENWLFEAITESYLPLIDMCQRLGGQGIRSNLTISVSPCLAWMLGDALRRERYRKYLGERIDYLARHRGGSGYDVRLAAVLHMHEQHYRRCQILFEETLRGNIISGFRQLSDNGDIALLTSAGTHAYLPLWTLYPETVRLQLAVTVRQFTRDFGRLPRGIWLPECAFFDGLDRLLAESGFQYFFLDRHGIINGDPRPLRGEFAPVHTPAGVAAFGRDWDSHRLVWLKEEGYPGDPVYLDTSSPLPPGGLGERPPTGINLLRGTARTGWKPYDPAEARARCETHARHFVSYCEQHIDRISEFLDRKPCLVALFDTEHFGHWWYEGPLWLEHVVQLLNGTQSRIRLVTPKQYLSMYPTNQVVNPSMSSWGYQGYSETWLMGKNHWIYPPLFAAAEYLRDLTVTADVGYVEPAFVDQYIRELMLAQSSDWAFMLHAETTPAYARERVQEHIANMERIRSQMERSAYDWRWLAAARERNQIFEEIDLYDVYRQIVKS
jgi:1,4-alpha-glucan branching enzyme